MPDYPYKTVKITVGRGRNPKLPDGTCPCPTGEVIRRVRCENDIIVLEKEVLRILICRPIAGTNLCFIKDETTITTIYTGDPCPDDVGSMPFDDDRFDQLDAELEAEDDKEEGAVGMRSFRFDIVALDKEIARLESAADADTPTLSGLKVLRQIVTAAIIS